MKFRTTFRKKAYILAFLISESNLFHSFIVVRQNDSTIFCLLKIQNLTLGSSSSDSSRDS